MKVAYTFFLITLLWSYWKAMVSLRSERVPLSPVLGWMAGTGYFVLVPIVLLVLNGGYTMPAFYEANDRYASVDLSNGKYFIPMFVLWLSLLIALQVIIWLTPKAAACETGHDLVVNEQGIKRALLFTFAISLCDYALQIWIFGGWTSFFISHWYSRQTQMVEKAGDLWVLYMHLSNANQIVFTAAAALYMSRQLQRREFKLVFSAFLAVALLLQMVMSGNRIYIALLGLAFLTSCWFYRQKKIIATLLLISPVVLLLFSAWAYLRGNVSSISENLPTYLEADLGNRMMTTLMDTTEGPAVMVSLHMVNDFGTKFNYLDGVTYLKMLTFALPRKFYPHKSGNFPTLLAEMYEPGEETSLGATQFGELYANFGPSTVLLLPLMTVLIFVFSSKLTAVVEKHMLLSAVISILLTWAALASMEDSFITLIFATFFISALHLDRNLCSRSDLTPAIGISDAI